MISAALSSFHQLSRPGSPHFLNRDLPTPSPLPASKNTASLDFTDAADNTAALPNGTPPAAPRASPGPNAQPMNGKPSSPYVERSNAMGSGVPQTVSSKDPKAVAAAASDMRNVVRRKLTGYVGFANLPNQWHRKSVRKGFNFNVMVVGRFSTISFNYMKKVSRHLTTYRRIWIGKVNASQHPLQHVSIST